MIALVVAGFTAAALGLWLTGSLSLQNAGYGGVWLVAFIGASSVFIPIPSFAAICAAAAPNFGLDPLVLGLLAGSAEGLGEMTGYLTGVGGRRLAQKSPLYPIVQHLVEFHGGPILFVLSAVPNPLIDFMGIAAGSTGYPAWKFLTIVATGKLIKSVWVVYACHLGIGWITRLVG